mmetsp:Transcript_30678/g.102065  ORF Transcript_30678/g.102065 Transcript_30678/m.102065 type:complete len:84 (-) Transcript_30678:843-1094(-)
MRDSLYRRRTYAPPTAPACDPALRPEPAVVFVPAAAGSDTALRPQHPGALSPARTMSVCIGGIADVSRTMAVRIRRAAVGCDA